MQKNFFYYYLLIVAIKCGNDVKVVGFLYFISIVARGTCVNEIMRRIQNSSIADGDTDKLACDFSFSRESRESNKSELISSAKQHGICVAFVN